MVLDHTVSRSVKLTRARAGDEESLKLLRGKSVVKAAEKSVAMINGDVREACVSHWCCGCCEAVEGKTLRQVQVLVIFGGGAASALF